MIRAFCQRVGIQLRLQKPAQKKDKVFATFGIDDIVAVNPIVKHLEPRSSEAQKIFALAQKKIAEGLLEDGYTALTEAISAFTAVYGPIHEDLEACHRILARISYVLGYKESAISQQMTATLICERIHGVDHPSTAAEYVSFTCLLCVLDLFLKCYAGITAYAFSYFVKL